MGRFPSGQREQTVNLSSPDFGGPNPPLPTKYIRCPKGTADIFLCRFNRKNPPVLFLYVLNDEIEYDFKIYVRFGFEIYV